MSKYNYPYLLETALDNFQEVPDFKVKHEVLREDVIYRANEIKACTERYLDSLNKAIEKGNLERVGYLITKIVLQEINRNEQ